MHIGNPECFLHFRHVEQARLKCRVILEQDIDIAFRFEATRKHRTEGRKHSHLVLAAKYRELFPVIGQIHALNLSILATSKYHEHPDTDILRALGATTILLRPW